MNFNRSEEQNMVLESLRRFLDAEVEPAFQSTAMALFPGENAGLGQAFTDYGMIKAPHEEQWGGFGMDWLTHLMVFEEIAYTSLDLATPGFINCVGAEMLSQLASPELKEKYLADVINCDRIHRHRYFRAGCWLRRGGGENPGGARW